MRTFTKVALVAFVVSLVAATQALAAQPQQNQWTFETEALFLKRNQTRGVPTSVNTSDDRVVLGTNDLRFGFRPGARFTLGYHPDPMNTFEVVYFGLHNFSDRAKVTSSNEELDPVFADGSFKNTGDFEDAFQHTIKYDSRLHNVELNYKRHFSPWGMLHPSLLIGLRYMSVPEKFSLLSADEDCGAPCDFGKYSIKTTNHLIGVQLGGTGTYRFGPSFDLGLRFKAGLFANIAKQRTNFVNNLDDGPSSSDIERTSKSGTNAAGVADAGLFATWNLHRNVALTTGYQILYVAGLALAPEQLASCNCRGAFSQLDASGSAFYHGPSVGLKISW